MDREIIAIKLGDFFLKEAAFDPGQAFCLEIADRLIEKAREVGAIV